LTEAVVGADGLWRMAGVQLRASIGRGGVRGADKREGDGATPAGLLPLRRVLYRADRVSRPRATVPVSPIAPHDGWCDDPASVDYNRPVRLPYDARCEALWREDGVYDVIAVLGWNDAPPVPGRGSAIFLHVARPDGGPTEGCIALPLRDLQAALAAGLTAVRVVN
jgi:L,D-peptidoglycan transpeptidase YkuD (ErfK/YbiS/YcfS/YnhG family)